MRTRRLLGVAALTLAAVSVSGYLTGYRFNPSHSVAAPASNASAADVTLTYLAAYDGRDFRLAKSLYPGSGGYSHTRAMGRYDDVRTMQLLAEDVDGGVRHVATDREETLVWVMVRYTATGFAASDRAVQDGPGGTGFKLSRDDPEGSWRIVDSGSP